jgi:hypothetical protein
MRLEGETVTKWECVDEWTDGDREKELARIRLGMASTFAEKKEWPEAAGKLFVDYLVMVEALRECTRRYLDSTGRGEYGSPTLESEVRFFTRLGENQVIFNSRSR